MSNEVSIFSEENKVSGAWMKFSTIGDSIEGTYLGSREVPSKLNEGMQTVYEIKVRGKVTVDGEVKDGVAGEIWRVGGRPSIDNQMTYIKPGQIIGMRYVKDVPSKTKGMNPAKIVDVYANPSVVDKEFSASDSQEPTYEPSYEEKSAKKVQEFEADMAGSDDKVTKIMGLAATKLGASGDVDEVKLKVMEATNKAFIPQNYDGIISDLSAM